MTALSTRIDSAVSLGVYPMVVIVAF